MLPVIAIDIETVPNLDMVDSLPEVTASKTLKDPAKIEADIAKKKAEQVEKMALSPLYGKICSFAVVDSDGEKKCYVVGDTSFTTELTLIENIISFFSMNNVICTWNGLGFDVPFIYKRAMIYSVQLSKFGAVPMPYWMKRFTYTPHADLMQIWGGWRDYVKLDDAAKALLQKEKQDVDFKLFPELLKTADGRNVIRDYNLQDSKITMELYKKMKGYLF